MAKPEKFGPGFSVGKPLWFAETFDGVRLARQYGGLVQGMTVAEDGTDSYDRVAVRLGDGSVVRVHQSQLRLSEPKPRKPAVVRAKGRPEAIDPAKGTETTIFDYLAEA